MGYQEPTLNIDSLMEGLDDTPREKRAIQMMRLADRESVIRILPPYSFDPEVNQGRIDKEWTLHWFKDGNDRSRPLVCSKGAFGTCPACTEADILFKRKKEIISPYLDDDGKILWDKVPADIEESYKELDGKYDQLRGQSGWYYNVLSPNAMKTTKGQDLDAFTVSILRVTGGVHKQINRELIYAMKQLNIKHPCSLNDGVYFKIIRNKIGPRPRDVRYEVSLLKKPQKLDSGITAEVPVVDSLPDSIKDSFEELAYDIHTLYINGVKKPAELRALLEGDVSVFDNKANGSGSKEGVVESKSSEATGEAPSSSNNSDEDIEKLRSLLD